MIMRKVSVNIKMIRFKEEKMLIGEDKVFTGKELYKKGTRIKESEEITATIKSFIFL